MPKLSWSAFIELHPAAHLVAGVIPEEDVATVTARDNLALLAKLAKRLALTGQYAMTVDRRSGLPEIHCAFARETDAAKFAQALNATGVATCRATEAAVRPQARRWPGLTLITETSLSDPTA
jgi:hypothetical protein